jgi:hypothetical protein
MLFDFPLAFTEDLQPGGINHPVCDFTPGERFETDINRLCPDYSSVSKRYAHRETKQAISDNSSSL